MPQITVDTGINTKPILNGAKEMTSAIRSLQSWVTKSSKSMDAAMVGYARAMQNNATASKEFKTQIDQLEDSAQTLQNELERLAKTEVDTKEYANLKAEIQTAQKELQKLYDINQRLNATGRAAVPTKEYSALTKAAATAKQALEELNKEYNSQDTSTSYARGQANRIRKKLEEEKQNYTQYTQQANIAARKAQKIGQETEQGQELLRQKEHFMALRDESSKKIGSYRKALSIAESDAKKFEQQLDELAGKIETAQQEYDGLIAKQKELEATGGAVQMTDAMRKNQYEVQKAREKLAELNAEKRKMETEGTATVMGDTTEEYKKAAEEAKKAQEALNQAKEQGQDKVDPLHIQQWKEMATYTGIVSNGLARVQNAALTAGHALLHPFQALDRIIPVVVSGMGQLASKALSVAISFGKMAINTVVNTVRRLGQEALHAAVGLAKIAGSAVIGFLRRLGDAAKNAAASVARLAGKAIMTGVKGIGSWAAKAGRAILGIGNSAKKSNGGIKQAITMLIRYGLGIRSIFILVRRLRSAVVDAFQNMAKQVPEVNRAISSLSATLGQVKNSLATAFQPVLNAVAPYLTQLMDLVTQAMTKVGMFMAALTGQSYVYKATKANYDYAKSLDKTKQSAKEAQNQLASFDELNILSAPKDSGSGSAGTNAADAGQFVKVPVESGIKDFVDKLKQMINGGEFAEIGELLAGKINDFIGSIDWEGYAVKIGNLVNGLVEFYNAFMEAVNWVNIGKEIAGALNALVSTVNFYELGRGLTQRINAIIKTLSGFLEEINGFGIGDALKDLLNGMVDNIDAEEIGETLTTAIHTVLDFIMPALGDEDLWKRIGYKLSIMLNKLFGTNQSGETVWDRLAEAITTAAGSVITALKTFVMNFEWGEAGTKFKEAIKKLIGYFPLKELGELLRSLLKGSLRMLNGVFSDQELFAEIGGKLAGFFNDIFSDKELLNKVVGFANNLMWDALSFANGFLDGFQPTTAANNIRNALAKIDWPGLASETWATIQKAFSKAGNFVDALFNKSADYTMIQNRGDFFYGKQLEEVMQFNKQSIGAKIGARISEALSGIPWKSIAEQMWATAKEALSNAGDFVSSIFGLTADDVANANDSKALAIGKKLGEKVSQAISEIPWGEFGSMLSTGATNLFKAFSGFFQGLAEKNEEGKSELQSAVEQFFAGIDWEEVVSSFIQAVIDAFYTLGEAIFGAILDGLFASSDAQAQQNVEETFASFEEAVEENKENAHEVLKNAQQYIFALTPDDAIHAGQLPAENFYEGLLGLLTDESGRVKDEFKPILEDIIGAENVDAFEKGKYPAQQLYAGFIDAAYGEETATTNSWREIMVRVISGATGGAKNEGVDGGKNLMKGIVEGAQEEEATTKKEVGESVDNVLNYVKEDVCEEKSPSKRTKEYGKNLMKGFTQGVQGEEDESKSGTVGVFENIFGGIVASAVALAGLNLAVTLSMNAMQTTISTTLTAVSTNFTTFWSTVRANTTNALTAMSASITTSFGAMQSSITTAMSAMQASVSTAFSRMSAAISSGASQMAGEAQRAFWEIGNSVLQVDWYDLGYEIVHGIQRGIKNNWYWLENTVQNLAIRLYNTACGALGIASPSKLFRDGVGAMIGLGIAEGFEDTQPEILGAVTDVADAMADKMNQTKMMPGIGTEEALASFGDKIADSFASLLDRLQSIADSVAFRTPAVAAGTVVPYNVAAQAVGGSQGLVEAMEVSNDDLANVVMQATNNAALAIVEAIQRYGGTGASDTAAQTNKIIDEINRRTRAQGVSPIII